MNGRNSGGYSPELPNRSMIAVHSVWESAPRTITAGISPRLSRAIGVSQLAPRPAAAVSAADISTGGHGVDVRWFETVAIRWALLI